MSHPTPTVVETSRALFGDTSLPESWRMVKLGEVCEVLSGFAWSSNYFKDTPPGLPIIRIQNLDENDRSKFIYWREEYDNRFLVNAGDLLLSLSGSFKTCIWNGQMGLLNQRIVRLIPHEELNQTWLLKCLEASLSDIAGMGKHAIVNNVSINDLRSLEIPLPQLTEQERIAAILKEQTAAVERARAAAEAQLKAAKDLPAAYLRAVFSSSEAHQWETKKLGDVCEIIGGNTLPESSVVDGERIYCLKVSDLESQFSDEHYIYGGAFFTLRQKVGTRVLNKGAVVFPKRGGAIATNKKRMLKVSAVLDPNLMGVQSIDESKVSSTYLFWWFKSWNLASLQSGNTVPQINQQDLAPLFIPIPSPQVQKQIDNRLTEQAANTAYIKLALQDQLNTINKLPAALLRQAFTGKL